MAQNREIGELGQIVTVDTSANSLTVNGSVIVGNSSINAVTNSSTIALNGTAVVNNTTFIFGSKGVSANGSLGLDSQVLTTNGSAAYWSSAGVNTNATYTWSNAHTFNGVVTFAQTAVGTVNNALYLGGTAAASYQLNSTLNANIASYLPTYTGVVNGSSFTVSTSTIANSTGVYTGVVNGSSITVGSSFIANSTGAYHTGLVNAANFITTGTVNTGTVYATSLVNASAFTTTGNANAANHYSGANAVFSSVYLSWTGNTTTSPTITLANTGSFTIGNNTTTETTAIISVANSTGNVQITPGTTSILATGLVNAASYTTGTTGTGTGGLVANTTVVFIGNNTINAQINTTALYIGGNVIANSTGANNAFNLGGTAAASYQLNSTLNANIASYLPTYTGVVNAVSYNVGTSFTANATVVNAVSFYAGTTLIGNTTGPYGKTEINLNVNSALTANNSTNLGGTAAASYQLNSTLNANIASYLPTYTGVVNGSSFTVSTSTITNSTGFWTTGTVNAASHASGSAFVANTTGLFVNAVISLAGSNGTAGFVLTSNGNSNAYWAAAGASANSTGGSGAVQYYNGTTLGSSANLLFTGTQLTIGNSSANVYANNVCLVSMTGESNPNTFSGGSVTTNAALNTIIAGPYTIATGNTLTITAGSRVIII